MSLSSDSPEFHQAVALLRQLSPRLQVVAMYSALMHFIDDDLLDENGDLPDNPSILAGPKPAPPLKLVPRETKNGR